MEYKKLAEQTDKNLTNILNPNNKRVRIEDEIDRMIREDTEWENKHYSKFSKKAKRTHWNLGGIY